MKTKISKHSLEIGQLVYSTAGRDKGQYYLVYGLDDVKGAVLLVDGKRRGPESPKRKNPLHLQKTNHMAEDFRNKVLNHSIVTQKDINEFFKTFSVDCSVK